jgi:hypothetical protein
MLQDLLTILKTKPLLIIFSISGLVRLLFYYIYLPSTPSSFGPDEGTYAALAKYVALGLPVQEFPGYGANLYNSARSVTIPSAGLIKFGFDAIDATRLVSSIYGFLSPIFLAMIFLNCYRFLSNSQRVSAKVFEKRVVFLLVVFTFFPSNFVWSTIGLRESASQFWLIATMFFLLKFGLGLGGQKWAYGILSVFSLTLAYGARPQTALIFSLVAFIFALLLMIKKCKFSPAILIFLGVALGQAFTTVPNVNAQIELVALPLVDQTQEQAITPKPVEIGKSASPEKLLSSLCKRLNQIIIQKNKQYICKEIKDYSIVDFKPVENLQQQLLTAQVLEYKRNVNALDAQSALPVTSCQNTSKGIRVLLTCNLKELPYRLFAFLFRPLPLLDHGSLVMNYAGIENLVWLFLIPYTLFYTLRGKKNNFEKQLKLILISYVLIFSSAAALYEGNLGTAFRHKSSILWPLILLLMISPLATSRFIRQKNAKM